MKKLLNIQSELKAPKGNFNSFGKYKYRSCEDILESVKPLLKENNCILTLSDEMVQLGDRYYLKATATLTDVESNESISNTAFAREEEIKKGMDGSQITATASSYARKSALNGLFAIDDTKDADTDEYKNQRDNEQEKFNKEVEILRNQTITEIHHSALIKAIEKYNISDEQIQAILQKYNYTNTLEILNKDYADICKDFERVAKPKNINEI